MVCISRTNASGKLTRKHPSIHIPDTFPDINIVRDYMMPKTRVHQVRESSDATSLQFSWDQRSDLSMLAKFCMKEFRWSEEVCKKKFQVIVYPAIVSLELRRMLKNLPQA